MRLSEQDLQLIKSHFSEFQRDFESYNNMSNDREYRFYCYNLAMKQVELLKEYQLYYRIYDEDDETSFIQPDAYHENYREIYQDNVERKLNIHYDDGGF